MKRPYKASPLLLMERCNMHADHVRCCESVVLLSITCCSLVLQVLKIHEPWQCQWQWLFHHDQAGRLPPSLAKAVVQVATTSSAVCYMANVTLTQVYSLEVLPSEAMDHHL